MALQITGTGVVSDAKQLQNIATLDATTTATIVAAIGDSFPTGGIVMWSGSIASIPSGWALCDGTSATPDLRNTFIMGAGTVAPAVTGGTNSLSLAEANIPAHTHSAGSFSAAAAGAHDHTFQVNGSPGSNTNSFDVDGANNGGNDQDYFKTTSAEANHTHTISGTSGSTGSTTAFDNRPAYYALAYIMKT